MGVDESEDQNSTSEVVLSAAKYLVATLLSAAVMIIGLFVIGLFAWAGDTPRTVVAVATVAAMIAFIWLLLT